MRSRTPRATPTAGVTVKRRRRTPTRRRSLPRYRHYRDALARLRIGDDWGFMVASPIAVNTAPRIDAIHRAADELGIAVTITRQQNNLIVTRTA